MYLLNSNDHIFYVWDIPPTQYTDSNLKDPRKSIQVLNISSFKKMKNERQTKNFEFGSFS